MANIIAVCSQIHTKHVTALCDLYHSHIISTVCHTYYRFVNCEVPPTLNYTPENTWLHVIACYMTKLCCSVQTTLFCVQLLQLPPTPVCIQKLTGLQQTIHTTQFHYP